MTYDYALGPSELDDDLQSYHSKFQLIARMIPTREGGSVT